MKINKLSLIVTFVLLRLTFVFGQYFKEEQIQMFGSRIDNPINIEVLSSGNKLLCTGIKLLWRQLFLSSGI